MIERGQPRPKAGRAVQGMARSPSVSEQTHRRAMRPVNRLPRGSQGRRRVSGIVEPPPEATDIHPAIRAQGDVARLGQRAVAAFKRDDPASSSHTARWACSGEVCVSRSGSSVSDTPLGGSSSMLPQTSTTWVT